MATPTSILRMMPRRLALITLIVGLGAAEAASTSSKGRGIPFSQPTQISVMRCNEQRWTVPRAIFDSGTATSPIARFSSVAADEKTAYILGNNVRYVDRPVSIDRALVAWNLDGVSIGRPPGRFTFAFPKAAVDVAGRLHILWAEPDGATTLGDTVVWFVVRPTSIWSAIYVPGKGWNDVRQLHAGRVAWGKFASDQIAGHNSRLGLAVPIFAADGGLLYLAFERDEWVVRRVGGISSASAASVAMQGSRIYVGYLAALHGVGEGDKNSVFLVHSDDGGQSWSSPALISRSGQLPAFELKVRVGQEGSLHLIWLQARQNGALTVRHILTADGGTTTSTPDDLGVSANLGDLQALVDKCGILHVVYAHIADNGKGAHLEYAKWGGSWSATKRLFEDLDTSDPSLFMKRGTVSIALLARGATDSTMDRQRSLISSLQP